MRFCPFCTAENTVEATHCAACSRRLPPVPQRRRTPTAPPGGPPRVGTAPLGSGPGVAGSAAPPAGNAVPSPAPAEPSGGRRSLLAALTPSPAAERRPPPPPEPRPTGVDPRRHNDFIDSERTTVDDRARTTADRSGPTPTTVNQIGDDTATNIVAAPPSPPQPRRTKPTTNPPPVPPRKKPTSIPPPVPTAVTGEATAPQITSAALPSPEPTRKKRPSMSPPLYPMSREQAQPLPPPPGGPLPPLPTAASTVALTGPTMSPAAPGSTPSDGFTPLPTPVQRELDAFAPPPTRILRGEGLGDRPFAPPRVLPIPEIPEPGLIPAARYAITFLRARFQRRGAIKSLAEDIKRDTDALDQILGSLGRAARGVGLEGRVFATENAAISAAESKRSSIEHDGIELQGRKAEENTKYVDVENDRTTRVSQAEHALGEAQRELQHLEGQRRSLREKRKDIERRQRGYLKAAEQRDEQVANAQMGESRQSLRTDAESHRRSAAELEPERQEIDRKLGALEKPIADATAKVDAAKAELESARRSLDDAREGYGHRLAELEAEQKRKAKEVAQAEAEIIRRLVTLGTLVNLNRVDKPEFAELYLRVDRLRTAIGARTTEIDKLTAERDAFDKASLIRGLATIGGSILLLITVIVLLRACV